MVRRRSFCARSILIFLLTARAPGFHRDHGTPRLLKFPRQSAATGKQCGAIASVQPAAGSEGETNFGVTSVAAPKAASSRTARYSSIARPAASGGSPFVTFDPPLSIGIGLDQARVDRKSFTPDEPLLDATAQDALEHATEEIWQSSFAQPATT
jgi:hypothetical protein